LALPDPSNPSPSFEIKCLRTQKPTWNYSNSWQFLTVPTSWTCSLHVIDICSAETSGRRNAMLKTCKTETVL
jgi:hypothetical protein